MGQVNRKLRSKKMIREESFKFFFENGRSKKNMEAVVDLEVQNQVKISCSFANNNTSYSGSLPYW